MEYKNELKYYISNNKKMNCQFLKKYKSKTICKFIFYFILNYIITAFTWYVIVLFCSTYPKSIINLLLCFLFNFIFSFLIPFFYYGFVTLFEYLMIVNKNSNSYKFSLFLLKL